MEQINKVEKECSCKRVTNCKDGYFDHPFSGKRVKCNCDCHDGMKKWKSTGNYYLNMIEV